MTPKETQGAHRATYKKLRRWIDHELATTPFSTVGELRDSLNVDGDCGSPICCMDWNSPYTNQWQNISSWLWLMGEDWKTVT
jgi:hypothetical protein